jgi:hypothetical protein
MAACGYILIGFNFGILHFPARMNVLHIMMLFAPLGTRGAAVLHSFAFNTEISHLEAEFLKILTIPADAASLL